MSVKQIDTLDAMGIDEDGNLVLLIVDDLRWLNIKKHLSYLQDKINSYVSFIENKQFYETYRDKNINSYVIKIEFLYVIPMRTVRFLDIVNEQLNKYNIYVKYEENHG